jgi:hypothetical protein
VPIRYRALRADAVVPFVEIGRGGGWEIVHEDGDPDGDGGVVLIEQFEVPNVGDDEFLVEWNTAREAFAGAQGYLGARLLRRPATSDFRFVSLVRWSSPLMYARADKPAMPVTSNPALYQRVTPS